MNFPPNGFPPPGFPAPAPQGFPAQTGFTPPGYAPAPTAAPQGYPVPGHVGYAPNYGAPQAPALPMPTSLGLDAGLQTAEEKDENVPPLPQGGHELIEVVRIYPYRSSAKPHVITFKADCVVVRSQLCPPGTRFTFAERVTGHDYPNHASDSLARVRGFLASLERIDPNSAQAKATITEAFIMAAWSESNPFKGRQCAVTQVTHKYTKEKVGQFGQRIPSRAIGKYSFGVAGTAVAAPTPVQAAPAAQAPVAAAFPPAGWQSAEPAYPGHWHNGKECITDAQLRALMAAGRA